MAKNTPVIAIQELMPFAESCLLPCEDVLETAEKPVYGIGNAYVPDHAITCIIPLNLRKTCPYKEAKVNVHVLWLESNSISGYSGLVLDKADRKLYWITVTVRVSHNTRRCAFREATLQQIAEKAVEHNPFLNHVIDFAMHDRERLLDYQVYSNLSDRFYYVELPFEDKVVMFGAGLHNNDLLNVGLVGKALYKDFFVSYAECTLEVYEQLKAQSPSIYERAQQMEKNRPLFSYSKVFFEKRRTYAQLSKLLLDFQKEPMSTRPVAFLGASAYGTKMQPYYGPAYRWMEEFVAQYQKTCK